MPPKLQTAPYPGLHPDLWDLVAELLTDPDPIPEHQRPIAQLRAAVARMEQTLPPLGPDIESQDWTITHGGRAVLLRSYVADRARNGTMLYIHGGGWMLGSLRGHDAVCADLARDTGMCIVAIDYALAPEHRYPTALHECLAAIAHLRAGASPLGDIPDLWLGGDSAGGTLALCAALHSRDHGASGAAGLFLIYPATDPTCSAPSYARHENAPYLGRAVMLRCWSDYLSGHEADPYAAPATAALHDLPQTILLTAELDPLVDEGDALAARLREAGAPVWHEQSRGLIHGFIRWRDRSAAAQTAFRRATHALKATLP